MKRALITGVTGQDGAYLARFLLEKGYKVFGIYRRNSTPNFWRLQALEVLDKITLIPADLSDQVSLLEAVTISSPDEIYNLAAQSYVGASFDQPILTANVDALGALNFLEIIRHLGKNIRFYQASTSELYGEDGGKSVEIQDENTPFSPSSPYAAAKLYSFHIVKIYREAYGIFACNGILFNHESPLRGLEFVTRRISNSVAKIKFGVQKELRLGNLEAKRDWGFSPDYVEAMWAMLQQESPKDYVIATNETHSVREFVEEAFKIVGLNWEDYVIVDENLRRPKDVSYLRGDYTKAKEAFGWEPKTKFRELVRVMVEGDIDRWDRFLNKGERFPWDAFNYPDDIDIIQRRNIKKADEDKGIPVAEPALGNREQEYVDEAIRSGWISSLGKYVNKFEEDFAKFCDVKYGVACSNGTVALHLALLALGIKEGDEVIVPVSTYISTANAVKYVNATPVFVDSDADSWTIDPKKIEEKITNRTRAIIPVHLYGMPCDMDKIMEIAKRHNLFVIEDCAEAHGAEYKGKKVGTFGEISCFSFFGNKIITTGEGGMCLTNDSVLKERMEFFRNQGNSKEKKYWHDGIGFNYRMTNLQAAIGVAQLERIEHFLQRKKENHSLYTEMLQEVDHLGFFPEKEDRKNVYWMYIILSNRKEEIVNALKEKGIETRPFFVPLNQMPHLHSEEKFPIAETLYKLGIILPSSVNLKRGDINKICEIIKGI